MIAPRFRSLASSPSAVAAGVVLGAVLLLAVVGPIGWGTAAARVDTGVISQGPSAAHLLGTDSLGRDILARVLVATRLSILLAVSATLAGAGAGVLLGALPSVLGRIGARAVNAVIDILLVFPPFLLVIFLAIAFGSGTAGVVVAFAVVSTPVFARLTQTQAASISGANYLEAARVLGLSRYRLLRRHVLPNIAEPLTVNISTSIAAGLLAISGLSFLGLGVRSPSYDWGLLLNEGLSRIYVAPAGALGPAVAIVIAGLGFQLYGETLARSMSPRPAPGHWGRGTAIPAGPASAGIEPVSHRQDEPAALRVRNLMVEFPGPSGQTPVRGVDITIAAGEIVGVVGESGSGKTLTALALAGLAPPAARVSATRFDILGEDMRGRPAGHGWQILGARLAMVFQNPGAALHPTLRIGRQLAETAQVHLGLTSREAATRAVQRLRQVMIPAPTRRSRQYAHELSGGMQQRAVIAMGLMGDPELIIADEPTTALDVTVQRQILRLLQSINADTGASVLLISHDLAMVGEICDRVLVMYAGRVVEDLPVRALPTGPAHPYTGALLASSVNLASDCNRPLGTIPGQPPRPDEVTCGCPFAARCQHATQRCATELPPLREHAGSHQVACWQPLLPTSAGAQ